MSFELRKLEDVCDILDHMRIPITSRDRKEGPYPYYGANGIQDYIDDFIFDDELVLLAEDGGNFGSKEKPIAYRISGKTWVNNHAHVLKPKNIIDIDYLCYSLMYYDVSGLVNGATRQKLTQSEMRKINIRYRSLEKQRQMVFKIKLISNIISSREHQLSNLNLLVKSRFIEMSKQWGNDTTEGPLEDYLSEITYGFTNPMPDTDEGPWKITAKDLTNEGINFQTARKTKKEDFDLLTAKSKPIMDDILVTKDGSLGRIALVNQDNICINQSVALLRCNQKVLPKFLASLLKMDDYQNKMLADAGGVTIKHIYITRLAKMVVEIPSLENQSKWLEFLQQVNKSKLAIQQSLDELETLKKSLMQQYFG